MSLIRKLLGQTGEDAAERYLKEKGYRILERNYRLKMGEVDIIALDRDTVVFVEVKTRRGISHGAPAEAVNPRKQRQIVKAATAYIIGKKLVDVSCRFDIISIIVAGAGDGGKTSPRIDHIVSAFEAGSFF